MAQDRVRQDGKREAGDMVAAIGLLHIHTGETSLQVTLYRPFRRLFSRCSAFYLLKRFGNGRGGLLKRVSQVQCNSLHQRTGREGVAWFLL